MSCAPPNAVSGRMRRIKDITMIVLVALFVFPPFLRWDRGAGEASQAILYDIAGRRLLFFNAEFIPRDLPIMLAVLIGLTAGLFLVSAIAGRIWCGFACPQTVWIDIFFRVERFMKRRFGGNKLLIEHASRASQLLISLLTGFFFLCWFQDAWALPGQLLTGSASAMVYFTLFLVAGAVMLMAVYVKERFCINMCPWPRFQVAFVDEQSLVVTYDSGRGEPRGKKRIPLRPDLINFEPVALEDGGPAKFAPMTRDLIAMAAEAAWPVRGDCIDCHKCVSVCPTNVDIRQGLQIGCIGCGLCVDACDDVMRRVDRPLSLIRFSTESGGRARKFFRAKTAVFATLTMVSFSVGGWALGHHDNTEFSMEPQRTPVMLANGDVRNDYQLHMSLHGEQDVRVRIEAEGLPGSEARIAGMHGDILTASPDEDVQERLLVTVPASDHLQGRTPFSFVLTNDDTGKIIATRQTFFWAPGSQTSQDQ